MREQESGPQGVVLMRPTDGALASKYDRLINRAKQLDRVKTIVAYPCDENALRGPIQASELGIVEPILVGP